MRSDRVFILVTVAAVLVVAWFVSREGAGFGIGVTILGLAATRRRVVLGIPVALAVAAAALIAPGAVSTAMIVGTVLVSIWAVGAVLVKSGADRASELGDGWYAGTSSLGGGAGIGDGMNDGGCL